MGFFSRVFGRKASGASSPSSGGSHAVLLSIRLGNDEFGEEGEVEAMHALQDLLGDAVTRTRVGELDGDEFGGGTCTVYMYGPDADRLWDAIAPVLEKHTFRKGSVATKRYGEPGEGREETINLHWEG
jgi:hypothetical protein